MGRATGLSVGIALGLCLAAALLKFWLDTSLPFNILDYAGHDDGLFFRLGLSISRGEWLGTYDNLTLAKGSGYPIFLAAAMKSGLPITWVQSAFQILAAAAIALCVARIARSAIAGCAIFILLTLLPLMMLQDNIRILREQIYFSLCVLVIALFGVLFLVRRPQVRIAIAICAGLVFGWAWITREEGVTLIPPILGMVAVGFASASRTPGAPRRLVSELTIAALAFTAVIGTISALNLRHYGYFGIVDFTERGFTTVISELQRIEIDRRHHIPVSTKALAAAANAGPGMAAIHLALNPSTGLFQSWSKATCQVYKDQCGQLAGGWFMWALRDVVAQQGGFASPQAAALRFAQLVEEIKTACAHKLMPCRPSSPISFLPPITDEEMSFIPAAWELVRILTLYQMRAPVSRDGYLRDTSGWHNAWVALNRPVVEPPTDSAVAQVLFDIRDRLDGIYGWTVLPLVVAGLMSFGLGMAVSAVRLRLPSALVFATALWGFVAIRMATLVLIHISSFPIWNYTYASPAVVGALVASVVSVAALWPALASSGL